MKFIIISFKSRNNLLKFVRICRQYNINIDIINTPNIISKSCGLSGKTAYNNLNSIKNIIQQLNYLDFMGIFYLERSGFQERLQRLYWLI